MSTDQKVPTPTTVESTVSFDVHRDIVVITPRKANGVDILNPPSTVLSVDQVLELAAKLILGRAAARAQAPKSASRLITSPQ